MISYSAYKLLHLLGMMLLFLALGGALIHAANGGNKVSNQARKLVAATHGIALVLLLVAGFGLLARLGVGFGGWLWGKLAIWLVMGAMLGVAYRMPERARMLWITVAALGGVAGYLALFKPF